MSADINKMDFKHLRNEVQLLRDELAIFKRKYEDIIYNIDSDNLSSSLIKKGENMSTKIEQTEEKITLQADIIKNNETKIGKLEVSSDSINASVEKINENVSKNAASIAVNASAIESKVSSADLKSELNNYSTITQTSNSINAAVRGVVENAKGEVIAYYTGIGIQEGEIKMITSDGTYAIFTDNGLMFFKENQKEGWTLEPSGTGGVFNYYLNNTKIGSFGTGEKRDGYYTSSDMVLKAEHPTFARFVVDLTSSGYREVKFFGLNTISGNENIPCLYANEKLIATQNWVRNYVSTEGNVTKAVFA